MTDAPSGEGLPPSLRVLKWLVIVLMLVMIGGVITIVGLLVTRMPAAMGETSVSERLPMVLPPSLQLPPGATAQAVTFAEGWIAVVTTDDRLLIFTRAGVLHQELQLQALPAAPPLAP